jgi:hypothetical protein
MPSPGKLLSSGFTTGSCFFFFFGTPTGSCLAKLTFSISWGETDDDDASCGTGRNSVIFSLLFLFRRWFCYIFQLESVPQFAR